MQAELSLEKGLKLIKPKENTEFSMQQSKQDPIWDGASCDQLDNILGAEASLPKTCRKMPLSWAPINAHPEAA